MKASFENADFQSRRSSRWLGRRYLFHVGCVGVPSFAVIVYLGFAAGLVFGWYESGLGFARFASAASILLVAALAGSRIWYLAGHPELLTRRTGGADDVGAGLYGGLLLSFAVSWPVLRLLDLPFWRFWDGGAIILLVGMTVARFGCLINGCCAGRETRGPFGLWLPDDRGKWKRRYPTQLFESSWSATILVARVLLHRQSDPPGLLFLGSAAAYGFGRLGLELLREGTAKSALPTRINVAFSAILVVVSVAAFVAKAR